MISVGVNNIQYGLLSYYDYGSARVYHETFPQRTVLPTGSAKTWTGVASIVRRSLARGLIYKSPL